MDDREIPSNFDVVMLSTVHNATDFRVFHREAKSLQEMGYRVCIIARDHPRGYEDGVWFEELPQVKGRLGRLFLSGTLMKRALQLQSEIYIFHDPELFLMAVIMTMLGRKMIYDCHENFPAQILQKKWIPRPLQWLLVPFAWGMEFFGSRLIAGVIIAREKVAARFPTSRTVVVRNFPVRSAFEKLAVGKPINERCNVVIYVGSLSRIRGIGELVAAFRQLDRTDAELWLVGRFHDEEFKQQLLPTLPSNARYLGYMQHQDVLKIYQSAKIGIVTLHPTPGHRYSNPVKLFEYLGAGLPVIASDFPELTEYVEGCGIQVNPLDVEELKNAIHKLLYGGGNLAEMSRIARERALNKLSWENEVARLEEFLFPHRQASLA